MASGTIILEALRRKWSSKRAEGRRGAGAAGGEMDVVLPSGWPEAAAPIYWRIRPASGRAEEGRAQDLAEVGAVAAGRRVRLWTPGRDTVLTRATLPTRSHKKIVQALPYALEDQLLDEPENLAFAYTQETTGDLVVAVTANAKIEAWRQAIAAAELRIARALPTYLAVPYAPGAWAIAFSDAEIWVRTTLLGGFSCPRAGGQPPALLLSALADARAHDQAPQQLILFEPPSEISTADWSQALALAPQVEQKPMWDEPNSLPVGLSLLAASRSGSSAIREGARPYLPAIVMLAIWIVLGLGFSVAEWWQLFRAHKAASDEMHTIFSASFPEVKTVLDPARQMQRELERLQARGGILHDAEFLPLLARATQALAGARETRVQTLSYKTQSLTLDLLAPDSAGLDRLKQNLQGIGVEAELLATNQRANGVEGRIRIKPRPAAPVS